jgi:hypothetical protein
MSTSSDAHFVVGIPFMDAHCAHLTPRFSSVLHFPFVKDTDSTALAREDVLCGQVHTLRAIDQFRAGGR